MNGLDRQTVIITGAGRGIGAACALAFGAAGAEVICADLNDPADTVRAIQDAGGQAKTVQCDVSDEGSVLSLFEEAAKAGPLNAAVNCAGIIDERPLLKTSAADFDRMIAVNLRGSFLVGREALRAMQGRKGRLIMVASDLAYYGRETFSPYVASKHGVLGLVRSWAKEFAPEILVNALCPVPSTPRCSRLSTCRRNGARKSCRFRWPGSVNPRKSPRWPCSWRGPTQITSPARGSV